jgi:hypothetical protein
MTEHEVTLGEIMRRLDELSDGMKQLNNSIGETYVRRDVYSADSQKISVTYDHMIQRLEKMESRSEWVVRTIGVILIGAIITGTVYLKGALGI